VGSGSFSVWSATLGVYYHLDTGKKPQ